MKGKLPLVESFKRSMGYLSSQKILKGISAEISVFIFVGCHLNMDQLVVPLPMFGKESKSLTLPIYVPLLGSLFTLCYQTLLVNISCSGRLSGTMTSIST